LSGEDIPEGKVWIIKKVAAANQVIVEGDKTFGYLIDGQASGTILSLNDGIQFQYNGEMNFNSI